MFIDYHIHTHFSDDSWYSMEQVVLDAIKMGINELCFTDHVDYGVKIDWNDLRTPKIIEGKEVRNVDYDNYFNEISRLQKIYGDKITLKKGLEFGMQMHTIPDYQNLYNKYPMDFVLLSIHQIKNKEFWTNKFQKGKSDKECYDAYYDEMYQIITSYDGYSCLAHMDLIRRYLNKEIDMFDYSSAKISKILEHLIANGKGIEINTSSIRYEINGLTPSIKILELYYELGGTIITLGSDSHKKEHLGFGIIESQQILKNIGFNYYSTFESMKPIFHKL